MDQGGEGSQIFIDQNRMEDSNDDTADDHPINVYSYMLQIFE